MKDLKKVLFIADPVTAGGATECMVDLVARLHNQGVHCTVCISGHSELDVRLNNLGARVVETGHERFLFAPPALKIRFPVDYLRARQRYLSASERAVKLAEEAIDFGEIDLIHTNTPRMDLGVELAAKYGVPHICHLRELSFTHFGCRSFRANPAQCLSEGSSRLIAVSEAVKREWVARGASEEKVTGQCKISTFFTSSYHVPDENSN